MIPAHRCGLLLVASALVSCGGTAPPPPSPAPDALASRPAATPDVLRGERLLQDGRHAEARQLFEDAVLRDPDDARAWLDLGLAQDALGDAAAAEQAYRRATEIDPRFADAFNNLGVLLRERGSLDESVLMLRRAVELDPGLTAARFNLALAFEDSGRRKEAERAYRATIEQLPSDPVPRINLAMLYLDTGRAEEAAVELREAQSLARDDVLLSIAIGEGLRRAGAADEAVPVLRGALERAGAPPPTELLAELALATYAVGDLDAAEAYMGQAIAQDEIDPALQYAYGAILAKQGQVGKARARFRRAIELDPDGPYAARSRRRLEALK